MKKNKRESEKCEKYVNNLVYNRHRTWSFGVIDMLHVI